MISCETFRSRFEPSTDDAAVLEHLRRCDACLEFAIQTDPDVMFRALGDDVVPPGGVDVFVDDVMREVRLRSTEQTMDPGGMSWSRSLAVAATLSVVFSGAAIVYNQQERISGFGPIGLADARPRFRAPLTTKPVVETYDSQNATIVEVPTEEGEADFKVVMIFDENLPADL
jgi:hypothetical protein